jgi:hypothetical protein
MKAGVGSWAVMAWLALGAACATTGAPVAPSESRPADLRGTWQGQIIVDGTPLIVTLKMGLDEDGTLDVRHRPLHDVPVRVVAHAGGDKDVVVINSTRGIPASFAGVRRGEEIRGTFSEAGRSYRFWLTRTRTSSPDVNIARP